MKVSHASYLRITSQSINTAVDTKMSVLTLSQLADLALSAGASLLESIKEEERLCEMGAYF